MIGFCSKFGIECDRANGMGECTQTACTRSFTARITSLPKTRVCILCKQSFTSQEEDMICPSCREVWKKLKGIIK